MLVELQKKENDRIYTVDGFEGKIYLILQNEENRRELENFENDMARYNYFCNHFVMTDLDVRQIKGFILSFGMTSFQNLIRDMLEKIDRN